MRSVVLVILADVGVGPAVGPRSIRLEMPAVERGNKLPDTLLKSITDIQGQRKGTKAQGAKGRIYP